MAKYKTWYDRLMANAQARDLPADTPNTELHHVLPRSLGGTNESHNLVRLTVREHYVAHLLLIHFLEGQAKHKMVWALAQMSSKKKNRALLTSREFERSRQLLGDALRGVPKTAEHRKKIGDAVRGTNNGMYGVIGEEHPNHGKKHSPETKNRISRSRKGKKTGTNWCKGKKWTDEQKKNLANRRSLAGEDHPYFNVKGEDHPRFGTSHSDEARERISKARSLHYIVWTPDGERVEVDHLPSYAESVGLKYISLQWAARNNKIHKGYRIIKVVSDN